MPRSAARLLWLSLVGLVILLDQWSKLWVAHHFALGESRFVLPIFSLTLAHNRGASFSFLSGMGGWQVWFFAGVAVVVSCILLVWLLRLKAHQQWQAVGIALILGGALGNLVDRLRLGYVIDFFHFHLEGWSFAIFNVADTAITLGAIMVIGQLLWQDIFKVKKQ